LAKNILIRGYFLLRIEHLDVCHGNLHVVWDLSLDVHKGEIVTLLGPNGSGKTTFVETIMGLNKRARGSIRFEDEEILGLLPYEIVKRGIALVPEKRELFPKMTVRENLGLGGHLNMRGKSDPEPILAMFPVLRERQDQLAGTLSGGEQQMLAIGRSLMLNPKLLVLDEPSLGLSPLFVKSVLESVAKLNKSGLSILLLEQNVMHALEISHRGYVLENGRITIQGTARELLENQEIQACYLGL
jgi:branched-chain amino acid transport system ATP-binding protein